MGFPEKYGLYDSDNEHENCGFGFIANIKNEPKHEIVHQALEIVHNLDHRGAIGADPLAGDGAGILIQIPHDFFKEEFLKTNIKLPERVLKSDHVYMKGNGDLIWISHMFNYKTKIGNEYYEKNKQNFNPTMIGSYPELNQYMNWPKMI